MDLRVEVVFTLNLIGENPWQKISNVESHLKDEFGTAKISFLLLPEVVRFDDQGNMNLSRKGFLKGLQQRLDQVPFGSPHINDNSESSFTDIFTVRIKASQDN